MKGIQIALGHVGGREAAALIRDGELSDLLVAADAPPPGTIYRAKATRPVKGQGGMFFDTPDGSAFLRGARDIRPGDLRLVQVSGYSEPGKAIPVTDRLLYKSRYAIATPGAPGVNISRAISDEDSRVALREVVAPYDSDLGDCGLIVRTEAAEASRDDLAADVERLLGAMRAVLTDDGATIEKLIEGADPHELAWRDWPHGAPSHDPVADHVAQAARTAF